MSGVSSQNGLPTIGCPAGSDQCTIVLVSWFIFDRFFQNRSCTWFSFPKNRGGLLKKYDWIKNAPQSCYFFKDYFTKNVWIWGKNHPLTNDTAWSNVHLLGLDTFKKERWENCKYSNGGRQGDWSVRCKQQQLHVSFQHIIEQWEKTTQILCIINGGTLGMGGPLIIDPVNTPHIVGICWIYPSCEIPWNTGCSIEILRMLS